MVRVESRDSWGNLYSKMGRESLRDLSCPLDCCFLSWLDK
jgi:hypothetical protein